MALSSAWPHVALGGMHSILGPKMKAQHLKRLSAVASAAWDMTGAILQACRCLRATTPLCRASAAASLHLRSSRAAFQVVHPRTSVAVLRRLQMHGREFQELVPWLQSMSALHTLKQGCQSPCARPPRAICWSLVVLTTRLPCTKTPVSPILGQLAGVVLDRCSPPEQPVAACVQLSSTLSSLLSLCLPGLEPSQEQPLSCSSW